MDRELDNANPTIFAPTASGSRRQKAPKALLWSEEAEEYAYSDNSSEEEKEDIDADEVFGMSSLCGSELTIDLLRSITDPEHPVSLEQLRVVTPEDIHVAGNRVLVYLTPTIPHCSMSTLIGMSFSSPWSSAYHFLLFIIIFPYSNYIESLPCLTIFPNQAYPYGSDSCDHSHLDIESIYESKPVHINQSMLSTSN